MSEVRPGIREDGEGGGEAEWFGDPREARGEGEGAPWLRRGTH